MEHSFEQTLEKKPYTKVVRTLGLKRFIIHGGVVASPTESCFGLGCDPHHLRAIKKLIILK